MDRDRVQQMLINLLMNAVKYTARGLRDPAASRATRRCCGVEVTDTGPGIPTKNRGRLFRAYDRLDAAVSHAEGTGLGLSITQRFARQMGGLVGHTENPGGGSVFWIELPMSQPVGTQPVGTRPSDVQPSVDQPVPSRSPTRGDAPPPPQESEIRASASFCSRTIWN